MISGFALLFVFVWCVRRSRY